MRAGIQTTLKLLTLNGKRQPNTKQAEGLTGDISVEMPKCLNPSVISPAPKNLFTWRSGSWD